MTFVQKFVRKMLMKLAPSRKFQNHKAEFKLTLRQKKGSYSDCNYSCKLHYNPAITISNYFIQYKPSFTKQPGKNKNKIKH